MKRFLVKVAIFAVCVFIGAWGLDYIICRGILKMDETRFQDYAAMIKGNVDSDIIILGSSRAKHHYNPAVIDSICHTRSFNFGMGGYPFNMFVLKYKLYREHNPKPSLIILNLEIGTLKHGKDIRKRHQSEQFFPLVYDKQMRTELRKVGYGFKELNVPMYRMFGHYTVIKDGLLEFCGVKHTKDRTYKGFFPLTSDWDGTELRKMESKTINIEPEVVHDIEQFLSECKAEGVEVVLVNSPLYVEAHKVYTNYDEGDSLFRHEADLFNFKYWDFNTLCDINTDSNNFVHATHLNMYAANKFTAILCDSLKTLVH